IAGVAVKLAGNFALAPFFGMYGILTATLLCEAVIAGINLLVLKRSVDYVVLGRRWKGFLLASTCLLAIIAGAVHLCNDIWGLDTKPGYALQSIVLCPLVFGLYPFLLFAFRGMVASDLHALPASLRTRLQRLYSRLIRN